MRSRRCRGLHDDGSPPAAPLVMAEPEFLLEFLIVALDAPAQLGGADQRRERSVGGESGQHL